MNDLPSLFARTQGYTLDELVAQHASSVSGWHYQVAIRIANILSSVSDLPGLQQELLIYQSEVEASTESEDNKELVRNAVSITYYSAIYWTEFYASGQQMRLPGWPIREPAWTDLLGYIAGHQQVMSLEEDFCAADPECHLNQLSWAHCNGVTNSSIYSANIGNSSFGWSPIQTTSTGCN